MNAPPPVVDLRFVRAGAYRSFALFGACGSVVVSAAVAPWLALPRFVPALVASGVFASAYMLAYLTLRVAGTERWTNYHYLLCALAVASVLAFVLRLPVLATLDMTVLGFGVQTTIGRIGCHAVGCCYGRPSRWGVRYLRAHVAHGFDPLLASVTLLPIQLVESIELSLIVGAGLVLAMAQHAPGAIAAWYLVAYAVARFVNERLRGDNVRPMLGALSEAQWTSLCMLIVVVVAERYRVLPHSAWHEWAAYAIAALAVVFCYLDRTRATARHATEVARLVVLGAGYRDDAVHIARTSRDVLLSAGACDGARFVTVSAPPAMKQRAFRSVIRQVERIAGRDAVVALSTKRVAHVITEGAIP